MLREEREATAAEPAALACMSEECEGDVTKIHLQQAADDAAADAIRVEATENAAQSAHELALRQLEVAKPNGQ